MSDLTVSDLWPLLLHAVKHSNGQELVTDASYTRAVQALTVDGLADEQSVAELLAQALIPSGMAGTVGWSWRGGGFRKWLIVSPAGGDHVDTFLELGSMLDTMRVTLDQNNPGHVAMVTRVAAVALGIQVGPGPVLVSAEPMRNGALLWFRIPATGGRPGEMAEAGYTLLGADPGDHLGGLVFRAIREFRDEALSEMEEAEKTEEIFLDMALN